MQALIIVDVQNDFLPGGALAVPGGDAILPVINRMIPRFGLVVATQDWHPADHGSFASRHPGRKPGDLIELAGLPEILWPDHCVQNTGGALFAPGLETSRIHRVFTKGSDPSVDSYSGFFDNGHRHATGLAEFLRTRGAKRLTIVGLATDYCVKFTALDARALGFNVQLVVDAAAGVNLSPGDADRAIAEMKATGIAIATSEQIGAMP